MYQMKIQIRCETLVHAVRSNDIKSLWKKQQNLQFQVIAEAEDKLNNCSHSSANSGQTFLPSRCNIPVFRIAKASGQSHRSTSARSGPVTFGPESTEALSSLWKCVLNCIW